ncbi:hypothetical protein HanXRQr2_Chr09g0396281 [Helianthus annuus]|nr:hypothetical protein HanXRQr2_Chr09g0396281 [Helianthus annuus]KAJ0893816.1 hypothetical protein HanPSC8_Chr09g0382051 [Helianthus annuus]
MTYLSFHELRLRVPFFPPASSFPSSGGEFLSFLRRVPFLPPAASSFPSSGDDFSISVTDGDLGFLIHRYSRCCIPARICIKIVAVVSSSSVYFSISVTLFFRHRHRQGGKN